MAEPSKHFPETRWSLIASAREGTESQAAEALDRLCRSYWPPLYAFARRWGADQDAAQDLVQEFLARFIERGDLVRSTPVLGKFRSFLLTAFQNYLVSSLRREKAEKRGGGVTFISYDDMVREEHRAPAELSAERAYDRRWAEETMSQAVTRVRLDYERAGNAELFHAMRPVLAGEDLEESMAAFGGRFGLTAGAATSAVFRLRARFREALRSEVRRTVAAESEVEGEIRYLLTLLAQ